MTSGMHGSIPALGVGCSPFAADDTAQNPPRISNSSLAPRSDSSHLSAHVSVNRSSIAGPPVLRASPRLSGSKLVQSGVL